MLREEFLREYGLSQNRLAKAVGISPNWIAEISADTALRLGLYFGNSPEFWLNLQTHYDLKRARQALSPEDVQRVAFNRAA
jgi:addiction module HigA family antidote